MIFTIILQISTSKTQLERGQTKKMQILILIGTLDQLKDQEWSNNLEQKFCLEGYHQHSCGS